LKIEKNCKKSENIDHPFAATTAPHTAPPWLSIAVRSHGLLVKEFANYWKI
jgi:hypothetical protein